MSDTLPVILMMMVAFALLYFIMVRPAQKHLRQQQQMQAGVAEGNRVLLTSGIFATVKAVGDRQLVVEIAPGVDLTIMRTAVTGVVAPDEEEFEFTEPVLEGPPPVAPADMPQVAEGEDTPRPPVADAGYEAPAYTSAPTFEAPAQSDPPAAAPQAPAMPEAEPAPLAESVVPPPAKKSPGAHPAEATESHPTEKTEEK